MGNKDIKDIKIKSILASIVECSLDSTRKHLSHILPTLDLETRLILYEKLCTHYSELTENTKISSSDDSFVNDFRDSYFELIHSKYQYEQVLERLDLAISLVQPLSDHSIRGTLFFIEKTKSSNN